MKSISQVAAVSGVILVAAGIAGRFVGASTVLGQFRAINVVIVGIALMVMGLLAKLQEE